MKADKPYAPSCDRNREPIFAVIAPLLADASVVLEMGSGTGQHAVYFAARLPHLVWQCSERAPNLPGIQRWLADAALPNTPAPLALDVTEPCWPTLQVEAVFTANTLHYMPWSSVQAFFRHLPQVLRPGGLVLAYGPFNVDGRFTSESNARFDAQLRTIDPSFGVRDVALLNELAYAQGLALLARHAMPANNQLLVWRAATAA